MTTTVIPRANGARFDLSEGDVIDVVTPDGLWAFDVSFLGFDSAVTRNILAYERYGAPPKIPYHLRAGETMYDGAGTPFLRLEDVNSDGEADIVLPGCSLITYNGEQKGCRDLIAGALGISVTQLSGMLSFPVWSTSTDDYYDPFLPVQIKPGDSLTFRALRDVAVGVSACPDIRWETNPDRTVEVTVTRA